jgi:phosphatidylserine/phosphatidylglycerophosphate/cardiolipin synthase-like enzyme
MQFVGGNRLTLLKNGEQYFPALVAAIDAARARISARWAAVGKERT